MKIANIKQLADKSPVDEIRGVVEKQYPPADPTDNDKRFSQHRQSILINDGSGEKLMITLMKEQIHILDPCEGNEIVISSSVNEKGDPRGLVFNTWQQAGKQYPNTVVKVYPEATMRVLPAGGSTQQAPQQQAPQQQTQAQAPQQQAQAQAPQQQVQANGVSQFDAELSLAARGYTKCLDVAEAIINDRPLLADDGESLRAIATNLWMSSKHKVSTIAPELVGSVVPFPEKGSGSIPMGATQQPKQPQEASKPNRASVKSLNDMVLVEKVLAGHAADDDGKLDDNGKAFLVLVDEEVEDRELWEDAYDELCSNNFLNNKKEVDVVFDQTAKSTGQKSPQVERFIVCTPCAWREEVIEEIGRNQ